jgi:hypothetical protein
VGHYQTSTNEALLAENWDGTKWRVRSTPAPAGADATDLFGVACPTATACTAVGGYLTVTGTGGPIAEAWDGTKWSLQSTPTAGRTGLLSGVSCLSATACTAVGSYSDTTGKFTLAEAWDGTNWTIQPTPNPAGSSSSQLSAVSCPSSTACTAVGSYVDSANNGFALAEAWDGTAWTIQPTSVPTNAKNINLVGVSCPSATACIAVGWYIDTSTGNQIALPLAEAWDGTAWTVQPVPPPIGSNHGTLSGVSCTAATTCTASGFEDFIMT